MEENPCRMAVVRVGNGISLCMIVKDEGKSLDRCLSMVRDMVEEIVIVDTGSTDDSIDIARRHGAVLIHMEWNGDFSQARNLSLAAARYPWIIVLDADEVWTNDPQTKSELMKLLDASRDEVWGYWVSVTSLLGASGEERVTDEVCRLFRNDPRIAFRGRIHEEVATSIMAFAPEGIRQSGVEVVHYGYLDHVIAAKNKEVRNMRLIRLALQQKPDQPELHYALAAEWFQQANYSEALRLLLPVLAQLAPECGYHSDLVLKTAYAWRELGLPERALAVVEAWAGVYGDFPDLLELGAVVELDQGKADRALDWLKQAKAAASTAGRYTSVSGAGTYRSLTLEGMAYEQAGRWVEAEASYAAALGVQPSNMPSWQRLLLLSAATDRPQAIANVADQVNLPPAAWQALVSSALAAHMPSWLLRYPAALDLAQRSQQPLAAGLALAQRGEDAAAWAALLPWAGHVQHGPAAELALWALGHKLAPHLAVGRGGHMVEQSAPGDVVHGVRAVVGTRQQVAVPAAARAAETLLKFRACTGKVAVPDSLLSDQSSTALDNSICESTQVFDPDVLAAAQALAIVGAWPAWLRLLQALPPRGALALLAAISPAARLGLLRAPKNVREELLALCGTPDGAQQPFTDEVPAPARVTHALLAGTLALLAGRQSLARDWAEYAARITARPTAAKGRPARATPPGLLTLLRLTTPGAAMTQRSTEQCRLLLAHL